MQKNLLRRWKRAEQSYLVNTGWNGTGKRISIKDTRGIIDAILNGDILNAPTKKIPYFTSKYLQNFRALIQESLILVTHMLMLLNGKKKLRILLQDSLRTSLNTKETLLVKHLYLLDRRLKCKIRRWMWESFSCIHFFVYDEPSADLCLHKDLHWRCTSSSCKRDGVQSIPIE